MKEYMFKNIYNKIIIRSLMEYLAGIEGLAPLCMPGTSYLLFNELKYSYKRAHKLPK